MNTCINNNRLTKKMIEYIIYFMKRMAERTWRGQDKEEESKGYIIRVNIHIKVLVWPCQLLQYYCVYFPYCIHGAF